MIFSLRHILCGILFFCFISCKAQRKESSLTAIAFYNLENLYDPANDPLTADEEFTPEGANHYTEKVYQEKLHNMAYALSQLAIDKTPDGPALIGVAEIENEKVLRDLVTRPELKSRKLKFVHFDSPDNRGIDVALLYHPAYFKVISARALPVDLVHNGGKEHTRDVLYVCGKLGKDTVHIFVNHWPSRREGEKASAWKRARAAEVNRQMMNSIYLQNPEARCIVMGDLNDDPVDKSITETLGAEGNMQQIKPGGLFNPWMDIYKNGTGSLSYRNHWNLFDQILVSYSCLPGRNGQWKFYQAEVFSPGFLKNTSGKQKGYPHRSFSGYRWINGYSDHFPSILYLTK